MAGEGETDGIVTGAGIVGLATALALTEEYHQRVVVLEVEKATTAKRPTGPEKLVFRFLLTVASAQHG